MDHSAVLIEQTHLLGELVRVADLAAAVATCPGWTLKQLASHVGRGHRWAASMIRDRAAVALDPRQVPDGRMPADIDEAVAWLMGAAEAVTDAVAAVGADAPIWTFVGPRPASWWLRRRAFEGTVHRVDAALAIGAPFEVAPELAADGLSEWLDLVAARTRAIEDSPLAPGVTLHLHAAEQDLEAAGEWLVRGIDTGSGVEWNPGHGKGDAAVRGRAVDLLLAAVRRTDDVEVLGDRGVWATWLERTGY